VLVKLTSALKDKLKHHGVESFHGEGVNISSEAKFESPCSIKWIGIENEFSLGAFSYAVSGFFSSVSIGRYTSIGEQVQIGRANHAMTWVSTSPFFYLHEKLFSVGKDFHGSEEYSRYSAPLRPGAISTFIKPVVVGNDVYIGHGAMIMPGVSIGDGAVIAAMSVVTKNVPPYAIVGGNPAKIIRMRLPPILAAQMLHLQWWQYAPWQLTHIDFSNPAEAVKSLEAMVGKIDPFSPGFFTISDINSDQ